MILLDIVQKYWILLDCRQNIGFYWMLLECIGFYWIVLKNIRFYLILLDLLAPCALAKPRRCASAKKVNLVGYHSEACCGHHN